MRTSSESKARFCFDKKCFNINSPKYYMIAVTLMKTNVAVIIPNWNGIEEIGACLRSLLAQSLIPHIIVVENGSTDGSLEFITKNFPSVEVLIQRRNLGFAGGVNAGIGKAISDGFSYVALLNNDAIAHKDWLKQLVGVMDKADDVGIVTCKLLSADKTRIDSTGEQYTTWGLAYPRDRNMASDRGHNKPEEIFGATGGASLYRVAMLEEIGLFDEDFFAYYEDIDLSFRAQLMGWKIRYEPNAEAYHKTGTTSSKIKGFTTYQVFKNSYLVIWKNIPLPLLPGILFRHTLAYILLYINSVVNGRGWPATKGLLRMLLLLPKKLSERRYIQKSHKVPTSYIESLLVRDLPPTATRLRKILLRKA